MSPKASANKARCRSLRARRPFTISEVTATIAVMTAAMMAGATHQGADEATADPATSVVEVMRPPSHGWSDAVLRVRAIRRFRATTLLGIGAQQQRREDRSDRR